MEVRLYSQDLKFLGVSESATSITWTRKYYDIGNFEIHAPITEDNVRLYRMNNIVWIFGAKEAGIIEAIQFKQNAKTSEMTIKGRFLESYFDRRLIHPTFNFSGKTEVAMRNLIGVTSPVIPLVELGELKGYDDDVNFQVSWKTLSTAETRLAQSSNLGFRLTPDFAHRKLKFDVYKGLDRRRTQHERSFAEFSDSFNNIDSATYNLNNKLEKTVAYVLGEGEGADRKMVIVGDDTLQGYERKELYVDARDLSSEELTDAEYEAALRQRGLEKLEENKLSKSFECDTIALGNFIYKTDYDLGDIVTVKKSSWDVSNESRITEVMEIYEHDVMQVALTLGNPTPTTLNMEE